MASRLLQLFHVKLRVVSVCLVLGCGTAPGPAPTAPAPTSGSPLVETCAAGRIGSVRITGAPRVAVPALAVLEGTLDDPDRTERITETAVQSLRWLGYARADIAVTRMPACGTDLDVVVTLGPRFRIATIDFETTDAFPAAERLAAIEDELGRINTVGGVHIEYRLERALAVLERRYRDAGWVDARIGPPRAAYDEDRGEVAIAIPIAAGQRYRFGAIRASGASRAVRERILDELGVEEGAWYDGPTMRRGIARARKSIDRHVRIRQRIAGDDDAIVIEAIVTPAAAP